MQYSATRKKFLKIAVIGAGLAGKQHIEAVEKSQESCLDCIIDNSEESSVFAEKKC